MVARRFAYPQVRNILGSFPSFVSIHDIIVFRLLSNIGSRQRSKEATRNSRLIRSLQTPETFRRCLLKSIGKFGSNYRRFLFRCAVCNHALFPKNKRQILHQRACGEISAPSSAISTCVVRRQQSASKEDASAAIVWEAIYSVTHFSASRSQVRNKVSSNWPDSNGVPLPGMKVYNLRSEFSAWEGDRHALMLV